jgi:prolyl oligopeptidase PreP (S9A serine peptidase family)
MASRSDVAMAWAFQYDKCATAVRQVYDREFVKMVEAENNRLWRFQRRLDRDAIHQINEQGLECRQRLETANMSLADNESRRFQWMATLRSSLDAELLLHLAEVDLLNLEPVLKKAKTETEGLPMKTETTTEMKTETKSESLSMKTESKTESLSMKTEMKTDTKTEMKAEVFQLDSFEDTQVDSFEDTQEDGLPIMTLALEIPDSWTDEQLP